MDTSDSEAFESADEEFHSDVEDIENVTGPKTINLNQDSTNSDKQENKINSIPAELTATSSPEKSIKCTVNSEPVDHSKGRALTDEDLRRPQVCWERGVNDNDVTIKNDRKESMKRDEHYTPSDNITTNLAESLDEDDIEYFENHNMGRPLTEDDMRRVQVCWEPDVYENEFKPDDNAVSNETVNTENPSNLKDNIDSSSSESERNNNESRQDSSGYAIIPPMRVTCWFEGVNNVKVKAEETTATKLQEETIATKLEEETIAIKPEEETIATSKVDVPKNINTSTSKNNEEIVNALTKMNIEDVKSKSEEKEKAVKSEEENMWEDDMWGEEDEWLDNKTVEAKPENIGEEIKSKEKCKVEDPIKINNSKEIEVEGDLWENDTWETVENTAQKSKENEVPEKNTENADQSWGNWGNWGISSVLNTVSQGLTNVIGVPDPEELARQHNTEKQEEKSPESTSLTVENKNRETSENPSFNLGNFVSGVTQITKLVENTGSKVITGGLGTLETIGKKTMEVLQENDPGLKKKRAFLKIEPEKPVLSQILREAKERADHENLRAAARKLERRVNYETLFDDHQGLVHLEALEMLSKQCEIKLSTIKAATTGWKIQELLETLEQVKELCELPEDGDEGYEKLSTRAEFSKIVGDAMEEISIGLSYDKLVEGWREVECWMEENGEKETERGLHEKGVESLAYLTALAVEQYHKCGELLLVKEHRSTADEADSLVQITTSLLAMITLITSMFTERLTKVAQSSQSSEKTNELITNIFYESANSSSYVETAFQLLLPVLKVGATLYYGNNL